MKYNKGFAPILIVLIVLCTLVVGGGAYYLGKTSSSYNKEINIKESNLAVENQNIIKDNPSDTSCGKDGQWIKLIYPIGGEVFHIGEKVKVKWISCNISENEKMTARINWDKTKDGFGYGTLKDFSLGVNDGEEDIIIPEKAYSSNPQIEPVSFDKLGTANLFIFTPNIAIFPKNIKCSKGENCMPSPSIPESSNNIPFKILPATY
jgi:hypothetical protein